MSLLRDDYLKQRIALASRLISHAESLMDRGEVAASGVELRFAAETEEEVAGLLEISGDEVEAAIHRVSAASCYRQIGEYFRAMTLLRAATATNLPDSYREEVRRLLDESRELAGKDTKSRSVIR